MANNKKNQITIKIKDLKMEYNKRMSMAIKIKDSNLFRAAVDEANNVLMKINILQKKMDNLKNTGKSHGVADWHINYEVLSR